MGLALIRNPRRGMWRVSLNPKTRQLYIGPSARQALGSDYIQFLYSDETPRVFWIIGCKKDMESARKIIRIYNGRAMYHFPVALMRWLNLRKTVKVDAVAARTGVIKVDLTKVGKSCFR